MLLYALLLAGCTLHAPALRAVDPPAAHPTLVLPDAAQQGALVVGHATPGSTVRTEGRVLRLSADGRFVFGLPRDAQGEVVVEVEARDLPPTIRRLRVLPREWPVERIVGAPPETVQPPPEIAARIAREQARVDAARSRDDARDDYAMRFDWPVAGRVSGRFGNQRVYVLPDGTDVAGAPHSGMDIAAPAGTPVRAPAAGIVSFAAPDLYLTGGTVLLDHGHGVSSSFLHLSRIDVQVGQRVGRGETIGAVGATGRATGPHLHWGMNWFGVRVDPLLVLQAAPAP
ncbi:MAG TPA: M23 family metallopeptidase [Xanthomonadaceae bacterium]|nr:M23 family metallopeptidase [Xanthomonadaceae bacterium]